MIDLATKPNKEKLTEPSMPDRPSYPIITLNDENVEKFKKETGGCEIGETYSAYVQMKVTGIRDDQHGKSLTFDIIGIDELEDEEGPDTEDEQVEKKSKYKNPAVGAALKK